MFGMKSKKLVKYKEREDTNMELKEAVKREAITVSHLEAGDVFEIQSGSLFLFLDQVLCQEAIAEITDCTEERMTEFVFVLDLINNNIRFIPKIKLVFVVKAYIVKV